MSNKRRRLMSVSTGGMPSLEGRSYVTAAYNVTSTSKATNIFGNNQEPSIFNYDYTGSSYNETTTFDINNIESIWENEVEVPVSLSHTFATTGVHTLIIIFKDGITSLNSLFQGTPLVSVDLTNLDTSNITDLGRLFDGTQISSVNVSGFDTRNVTDMSFMFCCDTLSAITGLNTFNTSKVVNMHGMFARTLCTSLDIDGFNTSSCTDMGHMFDGCAATSLDVSGFSTSRVKDFGSMFERCENLTSVDTSNFNTSSAIRMAYMFGYMPNITSVNVSSFNTSNVTSFYGMFLSTPLTSLSLSNFNFGSAYSGWQHGICYMLSGCMFTSIDLTPFATFTGGDWQGLLSDCTNLTSINLKPLANCTFDSLYHFMSGTAITSINFSYINIKNCNIGCLFSGLTKLTSISGFTITNVTEASYLFEGANLGTSIINTIMSSIAKSQITEADCWFRNYQGTTVDGSSWNLTNITTWYYPLYQSTKVTTFKLKLHSGVTSIYRLTYGASNLTKLYLTGNPSGITTYTGAFYTANSYSKRTLYYQSSYSYTNLINQAKSQDSYSKWTYTAN